MKRNGWSYEQRAKFEDGKITHTDLDIQHYLAIRQSKNPLKEYYTLMQSVGSLLRKHLSTNPPSGLK